MRTNSPHSNYHWTFICICAFLIFLQITTATFLSSSSSPATTTTIQSSSSLFNTVNLSDPVCLNSCSSHGQCSTNNTCVCDEGWLDVDCSLESYMAPICFSTTSGLSYCSYWRIQHGNIYQRIKAVVAENGVGWVGLMWNSTDGMTNGTGVVIRMQNTYYPVIQDIYAPRKTTPTILTTQSILPNAFIGFVRNTTIDVSFRRALDTGLTNHTVLPSTAGVKTVVSFAYSSSATFTKHPSGQATKAAYDLVGISSNNGSSNGSTPCPNNCGGKGVCLPSGMCMCDENWLGGDCTMPSSMTPICFTIDTYSLCMQWILVNDTETAYFRVSTTFNAWVGMLFDSSDGMSGGQAIIMQPMPTQYVGEYYATHKGAPNETQSSIQNISAWAKPNTAGWEYIFQRPCNTSMPEHVVFSTLPGSEILISYAFYPGSPTLSYHDRYRGVFYADMMAGNIRLIDFYVATLYIPVIIAFAIILSCGILLRTPSVYRTKFGEFLLRKRFQSLLSSSSSNSSSRSNASSTSNTSNTSFFNIISHDFLFTLRDMTFGELSVVGIYIISVVIMCTVGRDQLIDATRDPNLIFAHVAAFHLALTLFPVTRNSIWLPLFGISFERAIKFHRIIARSTLGFILAHGITRIQAAGSDILFNSNPLPYGEGAVYGTLSCLCIILMAVTAFSPIRRFAFEFFLYLHIPLFLSAVIFACLHSLYVRYYLIAPLVLYAIDHILRLISGARPATIIGMNVYEDSSSNTNGIRAGTRITELVINVKNFKYSPGQFVFINFPKLSPLQWHPFSISYISNENRPSGSRLVSPDRIDESLLSNRDLIALHILDAGKGTWTHDLSTLVSETMTASDGNSISIPLESSDGTTSHNSLQMYVDGPYGSLSIPLHSYTSIVFIAGGIGITPFASILNEVLNRMESSNTRIEIVTLIWTSRHLSYFSELFPTLLSRLSHSSNCNMFLFCTSHISKLPIPSNGKFTVDSDSTHPEDARNIQLSLENTTAISIRISRPDLQSILRDAGSDLPPSSVGVLACGPLSLAYDAQNYSMQFGYHLHKETFLL